MRAIALVLMTGCVVARAPRLDERPRWRISSNDAATVGCVQARAFIRKSGKAGFGVALQLRSTGDCMFMIENARIEFPSKIVRIDTPNAIELRGRSQLYAWLPVRFDNDAAWNDRENDATLVLDRWRIGVHQQ